MKLNLLDSQIAVSCSVDKVSLPIEIVNLNLKWNLLPYIVGSVPNPQFKIHNPQLFHVVQC